jgi:hypothetical protein
VDRDLVGTGGVDDDLALSSLDGRAVGGAQIAVNVLIVLTEELPVLSREVIVGEHDLVAIGSPDRDGAFIELENPTRHAALENLENDHVRALCAEGAV